MVTVILERYGFGSDSTLGRLWSINSTGERDFECFTLEDERREIKIAGETASQGLDALLGLMAFISVNLAFINILPIPGLDGGHVLIALIEGIIRRDIPLKVKMGIQQAGLLILLMLFITIMVNDIQRLIQ